jgi:hypothetical protein
MIYVDMKFCLFSCYGSLVIVMKLISEVNFHMAAILLYYIPQKRPYFKDFLYFQEIFTICHIMNLSGAGVTSTSCAHLWGGHHCHNFVRKSTVFQELKQGTLGESGDLISPCRYPTNDLRTVIERLGVAEGWRMPSFAPPRN